MKIGFIFQKHFLINEYDKNGILSAMESLSIPYQVIDWVPFTEKKFPVHLHDVAMLTCIGSIAFVKQCHNVLDTDIPIFELFTSELHKYSAYQHQIPSCKLLNNSGFILPFSEIRRRGFTQLSESVGSSNIVFRPDNGLKVAEVEIVAEYEFNRWITNTHRHSGAVDTTLFWLFKEKPISAEYRCYVFDRQCIGVSKYSAGGLQIDINPFKSKKLSNFVESVAKKIKLDDPAYVMDIAVSNDEYFVLELNCVATSGQYALNKYELYKSLNKSLCKTYQDLYGDF